MSEAEENPPEPTSRVGISPHSPPRHWTTFAFCSYGSSGANFGFLEHEAWSVCGIALKLEPQGSSFFIIQMLQNQGKGKGHYLSRGVMWDFTAITMKIREHITERGDLRWNGSLKRKIRDIPLPDKSTECSVHKAFSGTKIKLADTTNKCTSKSWIRFPLDTKCTRSRLCCEETFRNMKCFIMSPLHAQDAYRTWTRGHSLLRANRYIKY